VETIGRIRREHFLKGKTIRQIARDLRVSRNTVRKVLRSGGTALRRSGVNFGRRLTRQQGRVNSQRPQVGFLAAARNSCCWCGRVDFFAG
jgi:Homeodomain-like domain